jgi:hypothetical protein
MPIPTTRVELGFDGNGPGPFFVLDDPVAGVLDNTSYVLAGPYFQDVSEYVINIRTNRGKSRALDRYQAGQVGIDFNNRNRFFDPTFTASPFYGQIVPRRDVRIYANNLEVFYGTIDDWDLLYSPSGDSIASLSAYDGFAFLSQQTLAAATNTVQLSGARINAVLDDPGVNWPVGQRAIDSGVETLQADVVDAGTNALQYMQTVETTEPGELFIAKSGNLTFLDRSSVAPSSAAPVLADDGTGINYSSVRVVYGSELLFTQTELTRVGSTYLAQGNDFTSQEVYGIRTLTSDNLLHNSDAALQTLANYLVNEYSRPEYRFEGVEVILSQVSLANQNLLLGLELGSVCKVIFTPNGIAPAITEFAKIISISHASDGIEHRMVLGLGTLNTDVFVLDDAAFGILDAGRLSF